MLHHLRILSADDATTAIHYVLHAVGVDGKLRLNAYIGVYIAVGSGVLGAAIAPPHEVVAKGGHTAHGGAASPCGQLLHGLAVDGSVSIGGVGERVGKRQQRYGAPAIGIDHIDHARLHSMAHQQRSVGVAARHHAQHHAALSIGCVGHSVGGSRHTEPDGGPRQGIGPIGYGKRNGVCINSIDHHELTLKGRQAVASLLAHVGAFGPPGVCAHGQKAHGRAVELAIDVELIARSLQLRGIGIAHQPVEFELHGGHRLAVGDGLRCGPNAHGLGQHGYGVAHLSGGAVSAAAILIGADGGRAHTHKAQLPIGHGGHAVVGGGIAHRQTRGGRSAEDHGGIAVGETGGGQRPIDALGGRGVQRVVVGGLAIGCLHHEHHGLREVDARAAAGEGLTIEVHGGPRRQAEAEHHAVEARHTRQVDGVGGSDVAHHGIDGQARVVGGHGAERQQLAGGRGIVDHAHNYALLERPTEQGVGGHQGDAARAEVEDGGVGHGRTVEGDKGARPSLHHAALNGRQVGIVLHLGVELIARGTGGGLGLLGKHNGANHVGGINPNAAIGGLGAMRADGGHHVARHGGGVAWALVESKLGHAAHGELACGIAEQGVTASGNLVLIEGVVPHAHGLNHAVEAWRDVEALARRLVVEPACALVVYIHLDGFTIDIHLGRRMVAIPPRILRLHGHGYVLPSARLNHVGIGVVVLIAVEQHQQAVYGEARLRVVHSGNQHVFAVEDVVDAVRVHVHPSLERKGVVVEAGAVERTSAHHLGGAYVEGVEAIGLGLHVVHRDAGLVVGGVLIGGQADVHGVAATGREIERSAERVLGLSEWGYDEVGPLGNGCAVIQRIGDVECAHLVARCVGHHHPQHLIAAEVEARIEADVAEP